MLHSELLEPYRIVQISSQFRESYAHSYNHARNEDGHVELEHGGRWTRESEDASCVQRACVSRDGLACEACGNVGGVTSHGSMWDRKRKRRPIGSKLGCRN